MGLDFNRIGFAMNPFCVHFPPFHTLSISPNLSESLPLFCLQPMSTIQETEDVGPQPGHHGWRSLLSLSISVMKCQSVRVHWIEPGKLEMLRQLTTLTTWECQWFKQQTDRELSTYLSYMHLPLSTFSLSYQLPPSPPTKRTIKRSTIMYYSRTK